MKIVYYTALFFSLIMITCLTAGETLAQTGSMWDTLTAPQPASVTSPSMDIKPVVEGIRDYYRAAKDWSCTFTQTYISHMTKRTTVSEGKIQFKKPLKMRWDYTKPEKKSFITDGNKMWYLHWDAKEAKINPSMKKSSLESSIAFLWGRTELTDDYKILPMQVAEMEGVAANGRIVLELIPKKESQFEYLYLFVHPQTFAIEETVLIDAIGNKNRLTFSQPQIRKDIPDSSFTWSEPKGEKWEIELFNF